MRSQKGGTLSVYEGDPSDILPKLAKAYDADGVYWNRRYHKAQIALDKDLKSTLEEFGISVKSFNAHLLREPWEVKSKTGTPMKVFTPFWKAARDGFEPASPLKAREEHCFTGSGRERPEACEPRSTQASPDEAGLGNRIWRRVGTWRNRRKGEARSIPEKGVCRIRRKPQPAGYAVDLSPRAAFALR